jgi:hypothetical protein
MPENEQKDKGDTNSYLKYTGIGFQMIAIIGIFAFGGYKIDQAAHHTTQWVTAMLSLAGVFIAMYTVYKSLKN